MKPVYIIATIFLVLLISRAGAESFRTIVSGNTEVSLDNSGGLAIPLGINSSAVIKLGSEARFFRGIELELSAPQEWLDYRGSLAVAIYIDLDRLPSTGATDVEGSRVAFEPLPGKLQIVYQLPVRSAHRLRTTPYVTVPTGVILPSSFPVLFRLMPVIKGLTEELETMVFRLTAKPILSDEGAVKLSLRFPRQLQEKPFTLLIDDMVIENPAEEQLFKEGEHHLVILSDDYRNESLRFMVERAKVLDLTIDLKDSMPLVTFEGPINAAIFLDNTPVIQENGAISVEPGVHEAKFQVGDYTVIKTLTFERGKTYRVALAVDINVLESN
ncbi:MAG: hypothetical protein LBK62_06890 [Treponema sp.]|jgi:hypothetical protein|nr:hypothetical protein [Treponema sp.]